MYEKKLHLADYCSSLKTSLIIWGLISDNPRLNFNPGGYIFLFKSCFGIIFFIVLRAANYQIVDKKNETEFSFKAFRSEMKFCSNPRLS